ncbi:MAG TPA: tRNA pseudouridine(55) synthase TruB [Thermoanaerobaculia bacterium]|jgi:tRNA pseudouridine55 synthase|nr:tRNA pseudouridine(55) synthase TruB [Thermoanaerobaculia bacterium]
MQRRPEPKIDGVLLVDKKPGITSHDVVEKFRRRANVKKAGHTGTLDPLATGLLVLCIGKATRLQAYLMGMEKTYEGTIQFGWATDSYDATGTPVGEAREVSVEQIDFAPLVARFTGEIEQMPPAFSAKKILGVRAYEMARKGEPVELKPKRVTIHEFTILSVVGSTAQFRVRSSAGTYVRSLAHDLGAAAGVPAHLKELRRTVIGNFKVENSIAFDRLEQAPVDEILAAPHFQSLSDIDLPLEKLRIDWSQQGKMMNGQGVIMTPAVRVQKGDLLALGNPHDQLVAIGEVVNVLRDGGPVEVKPKVVLAG